MSIITFSEKFVASPQTTVLFCNACREDTKRGNYDKEKASTR